MLQYLLNATAIWAISLLCFDIFLRRESYHAYNRFYLLITFFTGLLLPLLRWQGAHAIRYAAIRQPVEEVIAARQKIVWAQAHTPLHISQSTWLVIIYSAGALIALCLLMAEVARLIVYYRSGSRITEGRWAIIETGKEHAPFSFVNTLFVSSKDDYSAAQWQMILAHETRHTALWHIADLMLMQAARLIFWFHPLVYIYCNRLLLVHEYQADDASVSGPVDYSRFLVEQALLPLSPSVTHSFNRSPIKKRIVMLTRRSSLPARGKMLVFVPVALVCLLCFSNNSISQGFERNGNTVTYRGNVFKMSSEAEDTIVLKDPVNGQEITKVVKRNPMPLEMNGKPIPENVDQAPGYTGAENSLRDYLLRNMKDVISKLDDGEYRFFISDILIDENGKIVYFYYQDIDKYDVQNQPAGAASPTVYNVNMADPRVEVKVNMNGQMTTIKKATVHQNVPDELQQQIFDRICKLMEDAPGFTPAKLNGKNVIGKYESYRFYNHFKVKDHKIYDADGKNNYKEL